MDTVLFVGFAAAYALLFAWGTSLVIRRRRWVIADLALLVIAALIYDNAILGLGSFIGEGEALEGLNAMRYWLHAFITPLLVLVSWSLVRRTGVRWARQTWAIIGAVVITVALVVYEVIVGAASLRLVADHEYGILSYTDENAPDGPPMMVLVVAVMILVASVYVWKNQRWVWLCIATVLMIAGSAIPFDIPSGAATNAFELILLTGIVATIAFQDRLAARPRVRE